MNYKLKFVILTVVILAFCMTVFTISKTNAKYIYNYSLKSKLNIGYTICDIKLDNDNPDGFEHDQDVLLKFKIKNFDESNNVNGACVDYYLKLIDENDNEFEPTVARIDGYDYITIIKDSDGNLVDEDGNIIDENGNIVEERDLSEEEKDLLIVDKKGYGKIELKDNSLNTEEKEINLVLNIPNSYGNLFRYKIRVITENKLNGYIENYKDFDFEITELLDSNQNVDIYSE